MDWKYKLGDVLEPIAAPGSRVRYVVVQRVADDCSAGTQLHYVCRPYVFARDQFDARGAGSWSAGVQNGPNGSPIDIVRFNEIELRLVSDHPSPPQTAV